MEKIKNREVVRKIKVSREYTFFIQALLEDTGIVAVSLGEVSELTIFYDRLLEEEVNKIVAKIENFCLVEFGLV